MRIVLVFSLYLLLCIVSIILQYLPFFRFGYNELRCAQFWLLSWVGICLVIVQLINNPRQAGATVMMYLSFPVVVILSVLVARVRRRSIIKRPVPHLNSPEEVRPLSTQLCNAFCW
jgi:hypothetical protein